MGAQGEKALTRDEAVIWTAILLNGLRGSPSDTEIAEAVSEIIAMCWTRDVYAVQFVEGGVPTNVIDSLWFSESEAHERVEERNREPRSAEDDRWDVVAWEILE
jgi:hypothetical protein